MRQLSVLVTVIIKSYLINMKKIIVATDFSAEADNAMEYAAKAAAEQQYELVLYSLQNVSIHALNARLSAGAMDSHQLMKKSELEEAAAKLTKDFGVVTTTYFASGDFFETLEECIADTGADMVVMGMAEKSLEQDMLGNTTTAAIHRLKIPILAVPSEAKYSGIKNIVFACDIARGVHKKVLEKVSDVAAGFGAHVEVFNVNNAVDSLSKQDRSVIDSSFDGISYYYKNVASGNIVAAIKDEVTARKAELLIMVPYKYGFWSALVHKSKTRVMASGSNVPLLSIPL